MAGAGRKGRDRWPQPTGAPLLGLAPSPRQSERRRSAGGSTVHASSRRGRRKRLEWRPEWCTDRSGERVDRETARPGIAWSAPRTAGHVHQHAARPRSTPCEAPATARQARSGSTGVTVTEAASFDTRAGTLDLAVPKLRQGSYVPEWLLSGASVPNGRWPVWWPSARVRRRPRRWTDPNEVSGHPVAVQIRRPTNLGQHHPQPARLARRQTRPGQQVPAFLHSPI